MRHGWYEASIPDTPFRVEAKQRAVSSSTDVKSKS